MKKVYIVHGWAYSLDNWAAFCQQLKDAGIIPVQLHVPGLTKSSKKVWDINGYVAWLDDELKDEKYPTVIGHSNGGRIALAYAQKHPGRLRQLILIGSAGVVHDEPRQRMKLKALTIVSKIGKPLAKVPIIKRVFYKLIGAQDYRDAAPNMKKTMQNMLQANKEIKLDQINLPVTLIWGRNDGFTPLGDGQTMERELPQAKLHIINDARHNPYFTHVDQTVAFVLEALKEQK